jgi:hypothetical protein
VNRAPCMLDLTRLAHGSAVSSALPCPRTLRGRPGSRRSPREDHRRHGAARRRARKTSDRVAAFVEHADDVTVVDIELPVVGVEPIVPGDVNLGNEPARVCGFPSASDAFTVAFDESVT